MKNNYFHLIRIVNCWVLLFWAVCLNCFRSGQRHLHFNTGLSLRYMDILDPLSSLCMELRPWLCERAHWICMVHWRLSRINFIQRGFCSLWIVSVPCFFLTLFFSLESFPHTSKSQIKAKPSLWPILYSFHRCF